MKISVLDSLEHATGENSADTLKRSVALAQEAERLGCHRFWIVEHHDVAFEACPAPEILAVALAGATSRIRIGTGGILLNNYSPYKVAEQARSLAALFPNRIDLGFGRSVSGPGPDLALKRDRDAERGDDQADLVAELIDWLSGAPRKQGSFAGMAIMPDLPAGPDAWLLAGSAQTGALAGRLGLRLACSAFHRPELVPDIIAAYRAGFTPAEHGAGCTEPQILIAIMGSIAPTQEEAELQAMPMLMANDLRRNQGIFLPHLPAVDTAISHFGGVVPADSELTRRFIIGGIDDVSSRLRRQADELGIDEIVFRPMIADPGQKRTGIELLCRALG